MQYICEVLNQSTSVINKEALNGPYNPKINHSTNEYMSMSSCPCPCMCPMFTYFVNVCSHFACAQCLHIMPQLLWLTQYINGSPHFGYIFKVINGFEFKTFIFMFLVHLFNFFTLYMPFPCIRILTFQKNSGSEFKPL